MIQASRSEGAQMKDSTASDPPIQAAAEKAAARLGATTGLEIRATILKIPALLRH